MKLRLLAPLTIIPAVVLLSFWIFRVSMQKTDSLRRENRAGKLHVAASFYPLGYFSSRIGGDKAEVFVVTPAGVEPHDFEPTTADIARIQKSDLLIINGKLEPWANRLGENSGGKMRTLVAGEEFMQAADPHVWLSPKLARLEADKILQKFIEVDVVNRETYRRNAAGLDRDFEELDDSFRNGLRNCAKRDFLTSHAAFSYLAKDYGLNQVAIAGLSPDAEPSAGKLAQLVNFVREKQIKYIFFEKLVNPRLSQTLALEAGAQTLVLDPLEGLTRDEETAGKNYFSIMKENLVNLQTALECTR